jgi:hypothetical protein
LLIEFLLLPDKVSLAGIDYFIIINVVFQVLNDLDSHVEVVLRVAIDELANVLTLVRALFNDVAIVLEEMIYEELVEILMRALVVLVYLPRQGLAEN